jgi:hypothetical protein
VGLAVVLLVTFGLATLQRKKKNKPVSLLALLFGVIAAGNVLFYSGHFFAVAAPVHVHHHVASETGHADAEYQNLAPHTPATVVVHFFLAETESVRGEVRPVPVFTFVQSTFHLTNRGPPVSSLM